jgi:hypothetical protein
MAYLSLQKGWRAHHQPGYATLSILTVPHFCGLFLKRQVCSTSGSLSRFYGSSLMTLPFRCIRRRFAGWCSMDHLPAPAVDKSAHGHTETVVFIYPLPGAVR